MKEKEIENVGMAYKSPKVNVIEVKARQSILAGSYGTESFEEDEGSWYSEAIGSNIE